MPTLLRNPFRRDPDDDDVVARRRRKPVAVAAAAVFLVLLGLGCWLAVEVVQAKSSLEQARTSARDAREALLKGNSEDTARFVAEAKSQSQQAHDATHSLPWDIASIVPWLGSPFHTGQQIADVVHALTADILGPSADIAAVLSPDRLLSQGRIDVQLLRDASPKLNAISDSAKRINTDAQSISEPAYFAALKDARSQLQTQTSDLTGLLENTALAARLAPPMMGADGPRTYFMGFQTNAEARGTGGLLGGFGILRLDNGAPNVDTLGSNFVFDKAFAPIDLGPDFQQQWGFTNPTTDFRNSNLSPHFPYAAQIWKSLWAQQSNIDVDGVIAIDPVALSYILEAVGPVTMADGEIITAENVVELTESTVYNRFPTDQLARKQYLQDVAGEVVKKITGQVESPRKLLDALGKGVAEGRIAMWSANPSEEQVLEETPLAHVVPDDAAPYAAIVVNNLGGNKLDYYLKREIEYSADSCEGETRKSTVTVRLTNTAPPGGLPDYVAATGNDLPNIAPIPAGTSLSSVSLYATKGAKLVGATANGVKAPTFTGAERGHPVYEIQLPLAPGQSYELRFLLTEPTAPGHPRVPIQPLLDSVSPTVSVPECTE